VSWWTDSRELERRVRAAGSFKAAAREHGCGDYVLRKWWKRHGLPPLPRMPHAPGQSAGAKPADTYERGRPAGARAERAGANIRGDEATVTSAAGPDVQLGDLDQLLRDRGLDPAEWEVRGATVNEWDGFLRDADGEPRVVRLRQLKAHLRRRVAVAWLFPAVEVAERHLPAERPSRLPAGWLEWIGGDQQAPYHDEVLHQAVLRWLAEVQPDGLTLTGDTLDNTTISRHPDRPYWNATPQECIDAGYRLLSEYRDAAVNARMRKLRGNHDWRLESELLTRSERMFGLAPAQIPGTEQVPGYSIRRLLHLDALGVELVGREGDDWKLSEVALSPSVTVRHAPPAREKMIRLGRSVVAGHTHRQAIKPVTCFDADDRPAVRWLVETGTLSRTDGLGYDEHPDWQPGFATCTFDADGSPHFELASWDGRRLHWRGETW
jgi:transposase-like protein